MTNIAETDGNSNRSATIKGLLKIDRAQLGTFAEAAFRHASDGVFVSLRAFPEKQAGGPDGRPIWVQGVQISRPNTAIFDKACEIAQFTATNEKAGVFCPPLAGFRTCGKADEASLLEGYLISVECDTQPETAREKLERVLGPATIIVRSGGQWLDPKTGELQDKLHLHWRLTKAAQGDDLTLLKDARRLATEIVGADPSNIPVSHPIRWPGTWHRKGRPRLCEIVELREKEVDLHEALQKLRSARQREKGASHALVATRDAPIAGADTNGVETLVAKMIGPDGDRSAHFQKCINAAVRAGVNADELEEMMLRHPDGCASKYIEGGRLRSEIDRSWSKGVVRVGAGAGTGAGTGEGEISAFTQDDVGRLFAEKHADDFRFCYSTGSWFAWDRTRWRRDEKEIVLQAVRTLCRQLTEGCKPHEVQAGRKTSFITGVEKLVRGDPAFAYTAEQWDQDHFLLGTPAGTVDLKTGELREARPSEGITKTTAVAPADTADCPRWLQFLSQVTQGDREYVGFLQRWLGYSLTGDTREHVLLFLYGPGGNGKGVFLNTACNIMGGYATVAAADTFTSVFGNRHPTDLAKLRGARMVISSETEKGKSWDESRLKSIVSGDTISARVMRGDFFDYKPQLKLTIVGNHKPTIQHVDEAIRRRILIAPFLHAPPVKDPRLEEKLREEWPAILRWMVDGCLAWQKSGLLVPQTVRSSTDDYFETQDTFARWLEERCEISHDDVTVLCLFSDLYADWTVYAKSAGEPPGSQKVFSEMLVGKGFRREKVGRRKLTTFYGLRLSVSHSLSSLNEGIFA